MGDLKYCRACLVTNVKMFPFDTVTPLVSLGEIYSFLLQMPFSNNNFHLCFECARLLQKCYEFKTKCLHAHTILCTVQSSNQQLSNYTLENIDRNKNKLGSNLNISTINITHYDASKTDDSYVKDAKIYDEPKIEEIAVKDELESINNIEDALDNISECANLRQPVQECVINDEGYLLEDSFHIVDLNTKKHKLQNTSFSKELKTDLDLENTLSDDEPLAKISKKNGNKENLKRKYPKNFNIDYFEGYATVVFLSNEDAKQELLLRKESLNYKNSPYKCEMCYRGYEAKNAFENHMKRHSSDSGAYKCDLCQLRFPEQRFLCKHRLACHKRKFYCKLCPYMCFCTNQAKTHVSLHKGKKYPCKECNEVFSMPNSLLMHKRLKHVTECVCELCGNTFATPRGLYSHNMKIHRQDKNGKLGPKCEDCGIHFATEVAWKKHLVLSSKHQVSNGCKYCGETFSSGEELKCHGRIHARKHISRVDIVKLPTNCLLCTKWLPDRNEYKAHMMSDHPQSDAAKRLDLEEQMPFVCEVCGQMFKKQCFLTYHQRKHTGERPYKCTECGKSFPLAGALSVHKSIHTRKRVHKCDMCGRLFTFKSALNKHMKVHLGIRPHKCAICDKSFINRCDVKLHIKYVHNKVPWPKRDRNKRITTEDGTFVSY